MSELPHTTDGESSAADKPEGTSKMSVDEFIGRGLADAYRHAVARAIAEGKELHEVENKQHMPELEELISSLSPRQAYIVFSALLPDNQPQQKRLEAMLWKKMDEESRLNEESDE